MVLSEEHFGTHGPSATTRSVPAEHGVMGCGGGGPHEPLVRPVLVLKNILAHMGHQPPHVLCQQGTPVQALRKV